MPVPTIVLDSVTHLLPEHRGCAAACASHGGAYAALYAAHMGVGAVILNDAGIGREGAGRAGIDLIERMHIPAACVSHRSCRIGDGPDMMARAVLSCVNGSAAAFGLIPGMACAAALERLATAALRPAGHGPLPLEARRDVPLLGRSNVRVVVMDSISLVVPGDAGHIVVSGSHGGLLGGRPETAVKVPVFAAVFNDAGVGCDEAGIARLPALDARGIAGACVSAFTARIGEGTSTLDDGWISALNDTARRHGGEVGQCCVAFVEAMVAARAKD